MGLYRIENVSTLAGYNKATDANLADYRNLEGSGTIDKFEYVADMVVTNSVLEDSGQIEEYIISMGRHAEIFIAKWTGETNYESWKLSPTNVSSAVWTTKSGFGAGWNFD